MKNDYATVEYAGNDFFVGVTPSGHAQVIDIDAQRNAATGPFEMLQISLAACTAADVISVLKKKRQDVTHYRVELRATRREEHPKSYQRIQLKHIVRGHNISEAAVEHAVTLSTEKYCGIIATVRPTAEVVATWEIQNDPSPQKQNGGPE
ncbi:MAG: OsmC family protein [Acidobacteriota bacterium]